MSTSKKKVEVVADLPPPQPYVNYRVSVVAAYTGLGERLIYRDIAAGLIKHARHGRAVTVPGYEITRLNGGAAAVAG